MIYKVAAVGFFLFVSAVCYTLYTVAKMAEEETEAQQSDLWQEANNHDRQTKT